MWSTLLGWIVGDTSRNRFTKSSRSCDYGQLESRQVLSANFPAYVNGSLTLGNSSSVAPYELRDTFQLESNPNSSKTVYLDFTGHYSSKNAWKHSISFPDYNTSGSNTTFTKSELTEIQQIYQNVAEDFLPLDVNVTTKDPGVSALTRTSGGDQAYGIRVVVTQYTQGFGQGTGGLAKRNSFTHSADTPTFVFNKGVNDTSWTISHEVGHTLGLTHDGLNGVDYHPGVGRGETSWGPIMGGAFGKRLTQWSDGDYSGSDNREDDLSVMTRTATGVQLRADVVGDSIATADSLSGTGNRFSDLGIIESRGDVDVYQFTVPAADISLDIRPFQGKGNLDVLARLYDSSGRLIGSSNPVDSVSSSFQRSLDAGTYYLSVDGVGRSGRYSDYGSLGLYTIEGNVTPKPVVTNSVGEAGNIFDVDNNWQTVTLNGTYRDPVIIAGPASSQDSQHGTVRVRNVQGDSFEIRIENWDYLTETHGEESVSYFVVESGKHQLADGTNLIAGNGVLSHRHRRVGFGEHFASNPIVFSQVVSARGDSAVTTRVNGVNSGSFGVGLQEEEGNDAIHVYERFSWVAVEQSGWEPSGQSIETEKISVSHQPESFQFDRPFGARPVLLAGIQTRIGDDTALVRTRSVNHSEAVFYLDEEQSKDRETGHFDEMIGVLAMEPGWLHVLDQSTPITTEVLQEANPVESEPEGTGGAGATSSLYGAFGQLNALHRGWASGRLQT